MPDRAGTAVRAGIRTGRRDVLGSPQRAGGSATPSEATGPLQPFGRDLWLADGPTVRFMRFFPYPTRMAVVRLASGGLWLWSPVELTEPLAQAVTALGPVEHLVAPNKIHHLFLAPWRERFPEARLHGAPGLARRRRDLAFDSELGDAPEPAWKDEIDQVVFRGSVAIEEVAFYHRASRAALVVDLVQRFDPGELRGLAGLAMRLDGVAPGTPRDYRLSFLRRAPARAARDRLLALEPERLVIAHGACAERGARALLAELLGWLG